jgi:hypothetical protein
VKGDMRVRSQLAKQVTNFYNSSNIFQKTPNILFLS